jgi:hypothetical protein
VHQVVDAELLQLQHHRAQVRPQDLGVCVVLWVTERESRTESVGVTEEPLEKERKGSPFTQASLRTKMATTLFISHNVARNYYY